LQLNSHGCIQSKRHAELQNERLRALPGS
jgi:hypothetical protein